MILSLLIANSLLSNNDGAYFRSPLDIPLVLSGNFGELRTNHFHAGLDFKTGGKEGLKVYSIEDGVISRIKVQEGGYGKAIYIEHFNGYTSVYAHLRSFPKHIEDRLRKEQYSNQSYVVDFSLLEEQLSVLKGEVIAYSGNSGRSAAPHLHFEIRDTKSEKPLNPLLFNFDIEDTKVPLIGGLKVYSDPNDIEYMFHGKQLALQKSGSSYHLKNIDTLRLNAEKVSFSIQAIDQQNSNNKNGVYSVELFEDSKKVYGFVFDSLDYSLGKYFKAHLDYESYAKKRHYYHKCFKEPLNSLNIYNSKRDGFIVLSKKAKKIEIKVKDYHGNESVIRMFVKADPSLRKIIREEEESIFYAGLSNYYEDGFCFINSEFDSFYGDIPFFYRREKDLEEIRKYSNTHYFGYSWIPIHSFCTIGIRPIGLDKSMMAKAVIIGEDKLGNRYIANNMRWEDSYLVGEINKFGKYFVIIDETAPLIKRKSTSLNIRKGGRVSFHIEDDLTGIASYKCLIDDKWFLFEYDAKSGSLKSDKLSLTKGEHKVSISVEDGVGNIRRSDQLIIIQ